MTLLFPVTLLFPCIARHRRAINLSYVDTHIAVVRLEELWQQYWHRGYQPRYDVVVPD